MIAITLDVSGATQFIDRVGRQIPFAASKAVDRVTKGAQAAIRASLPGHFLLRRKAWIEGSIKILKFPTKADPSAVLGIDPTRNVLSKFESQTRKTAARGKLAVPLAARPTPMAIVRADLRPKALGAKAFPLTVGGKQYLVQRLQRKGKRTGFAGDARLKVLYLLTPSVPIKPVLHFRETAVGVVQDTFETAFRESLRQAIATATR
jgi:hypothetical protein